MTIYQAVDITTGSPEHPFVVFETEDKQELIQWIKEWDEPEVDNFGTVHCDSIFLANNEQIEITDLIPKNCMKKRSYHS